MSMSRYWIPAESQHWPAATPPASSSGAPPSSRTPPVSAHTPPKEHDLPPTSSSASNSTVSTKIENYESLNHGPEEANNEAASSKEVKAEDNGVHKQPPAPPLQNYSDYYQQHYNPAASTSPHHNDLSSAFINSNSNVRSNPLARPNVSGNASKSNKNRPNAGT